MHPEPIDDERRLIAAIGAHTKHSRRDGAESTTAARAAVWQRYLTQVDPDDLLPSEERERRAAHARKADMLRLALKSAQARRQKVQARREAALWGDSGGAV